MSTETIQLLIIGGALVAAAIVGTVCLRLLGQLVEKHLEKVADDEYRRQP